MRAKCCDVASIKRTTHCRRRFMVNGHALASFFSMGLVPDELRLTIYDEQGVQLPFESVGHVFAAHWSRWSELTSPNRYALCSRTPFHNILLRSYSLPPRQPWNALRRSWLNWCRLLANYLAVVLAGQSGCFGTPFAHFSFKSVVGLCFVAYWYTTLFGSWISCRSSVVVCIFVCHVFILRVQAGSFSYFTTHCACSWVSYQSSRKRAFVVGSNGHCTAGTVA